MNPFIEFTCECIEGLAALAVLAGVVWCVAVYGAFIFTALT